MGRPAEFLYIDEEMAERTLRRRIKRLAMGMMPSPNDSNFQALSRQGVRLDSGGYKGSRRAYKK
jgi:hypothetical protein